MAVKIFVLVLYMYEPFSMLILTRMIEFFKKKPAVSEKAVRSVKRSQTFKNILKMIVLAFLIHLVSMIAIYVIEIILGFWHGSNYWTIEVRSFYLVVYLIIFILIAGFSIYISRKFSWRPMINSSVIYLIGLLIIPLWNFYYNVLGNPLNLASVSGGNTVTINPLFALQVQVLMLNILGLHQYSGLDHFQI